MKTKSIVIGTGVLGLLSGFLLSGNIGKNDLAKIATVATLLTIPTGIVAHSIGEGKGNRKANELEDKLNAIEKNFNKSENELKATLEKLSKLGSELSKIRENLKTVTLERDTYQSIADSAKPAVTTLQQKLENSLKSIGEWEIKYSELQEKCDSMEEIFDSELAAQVEEEVQRRLEELRKSEIKEVCRENDAITDEAMALMRRMKAWANKLSQRHEGLKDFTHELTVAYNGNVDKVVEKAKDLSSSFSQERDGYLTQIDCLHQRINLLQREIEGDLVEPAYGQFGYATEGKIANDIARKLWEDLQIPLAVKGYQTKSDGSTDVGYGFSRSVHPEALINDLRRQSENLAKYLGIHKITNVHKHEISDLVVLSFRREAVLKESAAKLLAGTPEEFIRYVASHPIRYRLIADPGEGKTPTTAVMLSAILKEGCRRGNTSRGKKVPHTLVSVSYPGAMSSLKDSDYPLERFLKYGTETAAIKSFDDAVDNWKYRQQNIKYAEEFFQIWVWDELDNTINSASDPMKCSESFKTILKQGGHSNIGWIVSGQSVMTSQIKGFKDDDRSLFTEIIIGIPKIRMYVKKYAKGKNSDANLAKLERNLDDLESYIESVNERITDSARLLRIGLVIDEKSPKLYFLPNLDNVNFDDVAISESESKAAYILSGKPSGTVAARNGTNDHNLVTVSDGSDVPFLPKTTKPGSATCPHCGSSDLSLQKGERYYCKGCKKKFVVSKAVFR
jgi:uncharacterized coiled-coil DUF342 family protein